MREMAVAGQFYPLLKDHLKQAIAQCFDLGCGQPGEQKDDTLVSIVCPHAGYVYSGWVAAYAYKQVKEHSNPDTVVVISPNHTGMGQLVSVYPEGEWETPFGNIKTNKELVEKICEKSKYAKIDEKAHLYEHSVEVQLPFLQYLGLDFDLVAITTMMQDEETSLDLAKSIHEATEDKKTLVVASSDFTHYEKYETAMKKDLEAIKQLEKMSLEGFVKVLKKHEMSVCGYGPIEAAMEYARLKGAKSGKLLKYATSGDVTKDKNQVVGYASIAYKK